MCQMIFFMDIDGTLKLSGLPLSRKMHEALRHLKKQGHAIIFCTGRTLLEIPDRWRHDGAIACFGHQIIYHDRILYQHPLTKGKMIICTHFLALAGRVFTLVLNNESISYLLRLFIGREDGTYAIPMEWIRGKALIGCLRRWDILLIYRWNWK